jgi:3-oxoacyl-[acyl-carrier-protein] synthase II
MTAAVITGLGVVSPLGSSVQELTRGVAHAGARLSAGHVEPFSAGGASVTDIPISAIPLDKQARIGRLDRLCRVFLSAAYLAVDAAGLRIADPEGIGPERVGLSFGTGLGCLLTNAEYSRKVVEQGPTAASPRLFAYTVSSAAAGEVSIALGIKGPNVTAHMGFAAGLGALGYGLDLIAMGKADAVLAGGADVIGPALVDGLRDMGLLKSPGQARPFSDAVPGVYPAEGAVVAVLESPAGARRRGARVWAQVDGYAAGFEPTLTRPVREAPGIVATMRRALTLSGHVAADVGAVFCSAHGTPLDEVERAALAEVFGPTHAPVLLAPKAVLGEAFAASGVLAVALVAGLFSSKALLPSGVAFSIDGRPLATVEASRRLHSAPVVMVNAVCYSGNIVSLLLATNEPMGET